MKYHTLVPLIVACLSEIGLASVLEQTIAQTANENDLKIGLILPSEFIDDSDAKALEEFLENYDGVLVDDNEGAWKIGAFVVSVPCKDFPRKLLISHKSTLDVPTLDKNILFETFKGTPATLITEIREQHNIRIRVKNIKAIGSPLLNFDFMTKLEVDTFEGTVLGLLFAAPPKEYRALMWRIEILKSPEQEILISWGGPVETTPLISGQD